MRLDETGLADDVQLLLALGAKVITGTLDGVVLDEIFERPLDADMVGICVDEQASA
jgi:hypothetical protein